MNTYVLIVDDSDSIRKFVSGIVTDLGYVPIETESGEEACEFFKSLKIDIALLDVNMPGIDGFETCRRLRKQAKSNWFPVIYLSGNSSDESIVEGLDAGGDAYVSKPVNPPVLGAILKAMGRISRMESELRVANQKLELLATIDGLTKISNRRFFDENLIRSTLQAKRESSTLCLLLLDIDYFKGYNDHYGHQKGDEVLVTFADVLKKSLMRPSDLCFRYGGEEFAVLLSNTDVDGAKCIAARIQESLAIEAIPHEKSQVSDFVTVSIGIAQSHFGDLEPRELLENADKLLYEAKENGRNRFAF